MSAKLLTVIVPSYNMEKYLLKCLGSLIVAPELMERIEVIVVNDGSTDRTSEIAHSFEVKFPGVFRVIDKENGHYGSCVNAGLKMASGVFAKILDADDSYDTAGFSSWLKWVNEKYEKHALNEVELLLTDYVQVDEGGRVSVRNKISIPGGRIVSIDEIPFRYAFQMHSSSYRTEMLRSMGYVQSEGIAYTDTEWMVYPMAKVRNLVYCPFTVYRYLVGREGQSMDPNVFRKCMSQRIQVFTRMMGESLRRDKWEYKARERMMFRAMSGMRPLYLSELYESAEMFNERFAVVDAQIRGAGVDVYNQFGCMVLSNSIRWHFVMTWRKHKRLNVVRQYLIRFVDKGERAMVPVKAFVKSIFLKFVK